MMGLETTAEEEEQKQKNKKEEERKKMDEEREKVRDEEYERERKEDERRSDRRREDIRRAAEKEEEWQQESNSRKVLVPPAPRQSHRDDSSAASVVSAATLIAQAIDRPLHPQQNRYADGTSWQELLWSSNPYRRAHPELFDTHNPAMASSVYPDSGYSSMVMNEPSSMGKGRDNGMDHECAAQRAPGPTTGSGDRSRSGGPGSAPDFFVNNNIGASGDRNISDERGPGQAASYFNGKYDQKGSSSRAEGPDIGRAMSNRFDRDTERDRKERDERSRERRRGGSEDNVYKERGGPDNGGAYARNAGGGYGNRGYPRGRFGRDDWDENEGRRRLHRKRDRYPEGDYVRDSRSRSRRGAVDDDYEERRERSRGGRSRSLHRRDEYEADRDYDSGRSRNHREERNDYNRRRGLGNLPRDDEGNPLHPEYDYEGQRGANSQLAGATVINNVIGIPGMMPSGVVPPTEPAVVPEVSVPEPAPSPAQAETVSDPQPTGKMAPLTPGQIQEEKEKSRAELWARANEQRDLKGRRKGNADAGSASQKAEVSNGYTQPEELAAETVTEGSKPRDDGTGMGVSSGSRRSGDSSLKPSDLSDDRDLLRKDKGQPSDRQGTATPTVSSHTVTGQGSESQDDERSRVDSAMGISPSQTKSSGDRLDEIPLPGSAMANSSIPPEDSDPQSGKTGYGRDETNGEQSPVSPKTTTRKQQDSIPSPASPKDSANSLGYDDRNSQIQRPESASPDKKSLIMSQGENFGDGAKREPGVIEKGTQRSSFKAKLAEISPVTASKDQYPSHRLSTSASLLKEPDDHVGMKSTGSHQARTGRKQPLAEERIRGTTKHAMQAQSSVLKRHNVTGPKTFGRLIKLALKSSPKMAFLSSVVMVIYLIGAVYLGNQVANILQVTAPSSRLSRRQSPRPSSSATSAAADPETSTFSSSTFESFDEDTQMLILINVWHAISWLVLVSLAHYIWENIPDPDGPRTRKNWLDKFGLWSMLRVLVTVAPMSVYLLLGARQLTSCAYLLNDPDAIAWSMGPDVGLTWNYLSENNGRSGSTPATVDAPVQDMGDWQLLLISIFFWLTGIPVLLYSIKRVQYPGSLSRGKIIRKVENRYGPSV